MTVRLSEFIRANSEKILAEFEAFARSIVPAGSMNIAELRDHAQQMLTVITRDLDTPQTKREGKEKAKGQSDASESEASPDTPAQEHGSGRATSGFTIAAMVSEYRALRSSVVRLWTEGKGELNAGDLADLIRFNEAIDQALAESTLRFMGDLDQTRDTFIGILGHDLRTPLGAIVTSAKFLLDVGELTPTARTLASTIASSSLRMNAMVGDLLDFTRSRLGIAMPIERAATDLGQVVRGTVEESLAARPDMMIKVDMIGDLRGEWDAPRLSQAFSNLLSNAISHGSTGTPITVTARAVADQLVVSVHNHGTPIPADQFHQIFDPMSSSLAASRNSNHLGLGLYIVQQVVDAHGGTVEVNSDNAGTTFTVRLPRQAHSAA
ncbi:MAG: sensor histidine kinase [Gemmatimonadota bacterium]